MKRSKHPAPEFEIDLIDFSRKNVWMNNLSYYKAKRAATIAYLLSAALIIGLLVIITLTVYFLIY